MRALASLQYGLGSIPAWCHMWVEFVFRSCSEGFLPGFPVYLPSTSNFTRIEVPQEKPAKADVVSFLNIVIYILSI